MSAARCLSARAASTGVPLCLSSSICGSSRFMMTQCSLSDTSNSNNMYALPLLLPTCRLPVRAHVCLIPALAYGDGSSARERLQHRINHPLSTGAREYHFQESSLFHLRNKHVFYCLVLSSESKAQTQRSDKQTHHF